MVTGVNGNSLFEPWLLMFVIWGQKIALSWTVEIFVVLFREFNFQKICSIVLQSR